MEKDEALAYQILRRVLSECRTESELRAWFKSEECERFVRPVFLRELGRELPRELGGESSAFEIDSL